MTTIAELCKALGEETRLRLAHLFLQTDQDICVCEMVDTLKLPQYQISKHLTILKNAGLLRASRKGTWVYYSLNRETSAFWRDLSRVLRRHLDHPPFTHDAAELKRRLALRENGKCVVGFVAARAVHSFTRSRKASQ